MTLHQHLDYYAMCSEAELAPSVQYHGLTTSLTNTEDNAANRGNLMTWGANRPTKQIA